MCPHSPSHLVLINCLSFSKAQKRLLIDYFLKKNNDLTSLPVSMCSNRYMPHLNHVGFDFITKMINHIIYQLLLFLPVILSDC